MVRHDAIRKQINGESAKPLGQDFQESGKVGIRLKEAAFAISTVDDVIDSVGFNGSLAVTEDGEILAGVGRYEAAKLLGLKTVPVTVVSGLSPAVSCGTEAVFTVFPIASNGFRMAFRAEISLSFDQVWKNVRSAALAATGNMPMAMAAAAPISL